VILAGPEAWEEARVAVERGQLVAFPTDTVYGVACDPYNRDAIEALYQCKGRQREKAIPLLLSSVDRVGDVASEFPPCARVLGEAFWPGALTIVVPRVASLPRELSGSDTIAVRVPNHSGLLGLISSCGGALATTSANLSGLPDAITVEKVVEYLGSSVEVIVDGGRSPGGVPSTVVNCSSDPPTILRKGAIDAAEILATLSG
jgi:L-threonylcarbamoyladenylate synthase